MNWNTLRDSHLFLGIKNVFRFILLCRIINVTVYDVNMYGCRLSIARSARVLAGVVHIHVSYQQIVCESFPVLGELRQSWFGFKAQNLESKSNVSRPVTVSRVLSPCL